MHFLILAATLACNTLNFTLDSGAFVCVDTALSDRDATERSRDILAKVFDDLCHNVHKTCAAGNYYRVDIVVSPDFCQVLLLGKLAGTGQASASPYWEKADYTCMFSNAHPNEYQVHANMLL